MCGITGFIDFNNQYTAVHPARDILERMTDALGHRGPDDHGTSLWQEAACTVGLGHRRLAILDLSPLGHQPMHFEHLSITFNGEIYNFTELKAELEDFGYTFKSHSDTEVILKAFAHWGPDCVSRFIGMFAFALFDERQGRVYLYRDRAGVKPLYFFRKADILLFASELKSLFQHPAFCKEIARGPLALYLQYGYIPAPYSVFKDTEKVLPGYYYCIDLRSKAITRHKYWDVLDVYNQPPLGLSLAEAESELEHVLGDAVNYRLVSDVPVGLFLSGGYDSSVVAALLQANRTERIRTFTIGFHEQGFDEAPYARQVAAHLGTEHTEYYCTQQEALAIIPQLPYYYDEPFGDSSAIPTTLISQLARHQVTVALSADAGDEVFAGYEKYHVALRYYQFFKKVPAFSMNFVRRAMEMIEPAFIPFFNRNLHYRSYYERAKELLQIRDPIAALKFINRYLMQREAMHFMGEGVSAACPTFYDDVHLLGGKIEDLNHMLAIDYKTYLVDDIMVKVDRATMSVGLEGREPLLDHRIIEFMARLPAAYKMQGGQTKYLFKRLAHKYLPQALLDRPKMGFGVPLLSWFRNELKTYLLDYLNPSRLKKTGVFNPAAVVAMRDAYFSGSLDRARQLWFFLMFEMWHERWMR